LITRANDLYTTGDLLKSRESYQQASGLFPEETYPKQRVTFITNRIDSLYRANKADYDKAVSNGDRFFASYEFDKAIDAYTEAARILPMEDYPKDMISKIRRTIEENAIVDVLKTPVTITSGDEKKFTFEPVNIASRKDNFIYLKIKNLSNKPFNVLVRYGKDGQAGGGVVIRNLSLDGKVNERLISVRDQDPWYRVDNNWIGIAPQGGDVEVSFIQVSRVIK
jgi:tetratricopeptide (TPR) repeat protein